MGRAGTYTLGGALTAIAVAAMAWSAFPPEGGPDQRLVATVAATFDDLAEWIGLSVGSGGPIRSEDEIDWRAAAQTVQGGDATRGARLMIDYGCGACHDIPGIAEANGAVGPPLGGLRDRAYVAGVLPNRPDGLVRWIVDPTVHSPQTAMPDLGVSEAEARHMSAFLYAIGGR